MNINLILSVIAIIWLFILSGISFWVYSLFKDLIKIAKNKEFTNNTTEIKEIKSEIVRINKQSKQNIQKVGLVKYNPFKEIGGDHSFSLALLDGDKNGIIITSLHTRERTRVYLKDVVLGKTKLDLSTDEEKALKLAIK